MPHRRVILFAIAAPALIGIVALGSVPLLRNPNVDRLAIAALALASGTLVVALLGMLLSTALARLIAGKRKLSESVALWAVRVVHISALAALLLHAMAALTALLLIGLMINQLIASPASLPQQLTQRIVAAALLALFVAFVVMLARIGRAIWESDLPLSITVLGKRLPSGHGQTIWRHVRDLAEFMDAPIPDNIVVCLDLGCFVTEAEVRCLDTTLRGRTLCLSLPFMRVSTVEEIDAVLAHELAHFRSSDTRLARACARLFHGLTGRADISGAILRHIDSLLLAGPAVAILRHFRAQIEPRVTTLMRDNETRADLAAAETTRAAALALSLARAHLSMAWEEIAQEIFEQSQQPGYTRIDNYAALFEDAARGDGIDVNREALAASTQPHPTDTHPPLSQRLRELHINADDALACALDIPDAGDRALALFEDVAGLETELTAALLALSHVKGAAAGFRQHAAAARLGGGAGTGAPQYLPSEVLVYAARGKTLFWAACGALIAALFWLLAGALMFGIIREAIAQNPLDLRLAFVAALAALLTCAAALLSAYTLHYGWLGLGRRPVLRLCPYGIQPFNEIAAGDILAWSELADVVIGSQDQHGAAKALLFFSADEDAILRRIRPWRRKLMRLFPATFPTPHFVANGVLPMSLQSAYDLIARYHEQHVRPVR